MNSYILIKNSKNLRKIKCLINSKGQIWQFDFIFALLLVIGTIVITYQYTTHINPSKDIDDLSTNAFYISEGLLGSGIPSNWNNTNVQQIGLITNGTLSRSKLNSFYSMSDTMRRVKLGIDQNVYMIITNLSQNLTFSNRTYVGAQIVNAKQSAIATRYAVLDGYLVSLQVTVWS